MKLGENITDIHKANRCLIIKILTEVDRISRIDLARMTGLNKATITNIINEFTAMGIVESCGSVQASNGRKTAGISLCMRDVASVVIRINRERLSFALSDVQGNLTHIRKVDYDHVDGIDDILDKLFHHTGEMLRLCADKRVLGISIAILGWLYKHEGKNIAMVDGLPELSRKDIRREMAERFPDYRVIIDHDANMSAVAEWKEYKRDPQAAGRSMLNMVCGIGFGGGIIIDGKLYHGMCGIAGEVGHVGINFNSDKYAANSTNYRGTYEEYASPRALHHEVMNRLMDFPDTPLNEHSSIQDIYAQYKNGDMLANWAVNRMAKLMAYGLTGLIFVLNPDVIVLGDEIIHSERFMQRLRTSLRAYLPPLIYESLDIRISKFDGNAIISGAGIALVNQYLESYEMIDFLQKGI